MNRIRVSENFFLDEFIPPAIYKARGAKSIELIDSRIIRIAQLLRDKCGKAVTINNWENGGPYHESGLREFNTKTGARYSQHKYGRAIDVKVAGMTPAEVHAIILENEDMFMAAGLTTLERLEDSPTWTHCDCRHSEKDSIQIVKP